MDAAAIFKIVGPIAGIGGIALGVFLLLFREVIRKKIFPQLTKDQAYRIIRLFMILTFIIALVGIAAWVISVWPSNQPLPMEPDIEDPDTSRTGPEDPSVSPLSQSNSIDQVSNNPDTNATEPKYLLNIMTPSGARIYVEGEPVGPSVYLAKGTYTVCVEMDSLWAEKVQQVRSNTPNLANFTDDEMKPRGQGGCQQ